MEPTELVVAKINATVKILEWAKETIEPGIGGSPQALHAALTEAFRSVYRGISETVASGEVEVDVRQVTTTSS